ncbi:AsnC family transcriptional regulator [Streptomyces monashensis]|uniref:Lrp/AsnC family transcriptional regulator n=1 Tax=Streptomyces monashensis TaxID=1678012 RepID=UPI0033ECEE7D
MKDGPHTTPAPLDQLDRQIIRALQVEARTPFRRIGEVVGVSEQTIARRYRRMRGEGLLRVLGKLDPHKLRGSDWLVRVQCRPNSAMDLAGALARYEQANWVSLTAGGAEIVCTVRAQHPTGQDELLLQKLPQTAQVLQLDANLVLHRFDEGGRHWTGYDHQLDDRQLDALAERHGRVAGARLDEVSLTPVDERLLVELASDGRVSYTHVAQFIGWSPSRVARRVDELRAAGVLYFDVEFSPHLMGIGTLTYLWLSVAPARLHRIGAALATHAETAWVAAVAGERNLVAMVLCTGPEALYTYVNASIGSLAGVRAVAMSPLVHRVKHASPVSVGHRLDASTSSAPAPGQFRGSV